MSESRFEEQQIISKLNSEIARYEKDPLYP